MTNPERERGSGTLLGIALMAVVALAATAIAVTAGAFAARAQAQAVADVAALEAAFHARDAVALGGGGAQIREPACEAAAAVASTNDVHLETCSVATTGAVTVAIRVESGPWSVTRHARAGTR